LTNPLFAEASSPRLLAAFRRGQLARSLAHAAPAKDYLRRDALHGRPRRAGLLRGLRMRTCSPDPEVFTGGMIGRPAGYFCLRIPRRSRDANSSLVSCRYPAKSGPSLGWGRRAGAAHSSRRQCGVSRRRPAKLTQDIGKVRTSSDYPVGVKASENYFGDGRRRLNADGRPTLANIVGTAEFARPAHSGYAASFSASRMIRDMAGHAIASITVSIGMKKVRDPSGYS
jgi:hypothetical protein